MKQRIREFIFRHAWFFDRWKWARKLIGGRWELWYVDYPVCALFWRKTIEGVKRPTPLCIGRPMAVEVYDAMH